MMYEFSKNTEKSKNNLQYLFSHTLDYQHLKKHMNRNLANYLRIIDTNNRFGKRPNLK